MADEVFYHFMPIAWRDSDLDTYRFGDFGGMEASLDYLADTLGVTAIWMNPIHPSPAYHGYQHGPGDQINSRFGTEAQFLQFVQQAHARGIRVFVDFVAYAISHESIYFQDAFNNPSSVYDDWLAFNNGSNTNYLGGTFPTWDGATVGFIHWDLRNAATRDLVTQWAQKWLDPNSDGDPSDGIDGYRLDHVWQTYPNGPGGWGYHVDSFWAPWRDSLRAVNPDVFLFAEQADWGSHGTELFAGLDASFTKPLEFAARSALQSESAGPLRSEMAATNGAMAAASLPGSFMCTIGNHDVDRLASVIGDSFAKGRVAAAVLLTQPYTPIIYYGDEIGMRGVKASGYGGDAVDIPFREPFKWNTIAGPPMSNYHVLNTPAYTNSYSQNFDGRSVEEQFGVGGSLLESYREFIALRRASAALRRGGYTPVPNNEDAVWTFVRDHASQQVLVAINLSGGSRNDVLDLSGFEVAGGSTTPVDLLGGTTYPDITEANKGAYALSLNGYGVVVLQAALTPIPPPPTTVDGTEIPQDFGGANVYATQDTPTALGDNVGELNQLFLRTESDRLHVGITGNMTPNQYGLCLLLDTQSGGQSTLDFSNTSPPPAGPDQLTGLQLDAGFDPDWMIFVNSFNGTLYTDQFQLLGSGVAKTYRGQGTVNDGDGFLTGGFNPNGMKVALDNGNVQGVTGSSAAAAATATDGFELEIPYADVGIPTSGNPTIRVAAFILKPDGDVTNQWLPGIGGGGNLGVAPDMQSVPGAQFVAATLPIETADVGDPPGIARPDLRFTNPARSQARIALAVPERARVRVTIHDAQGRLVRVLLDEHVAAGERTLTWGGADQEGRGVSAGVYFVTVRAGQASRTERMVFLR